MKNKETFIFILVMITTTFVYGQIKNPGFTGKQSEPDSIFWQPQYQIIPAKSDFTSLGFEVTAPSADHLRTPYYDPRAVMPDNLLFLDSRGSSYYVPRQVNHKLAHIMNRPTANEVVPVFAVAVLAAKLAMQHIKIENIIRIDAKDYILEEKYFPIMLDAWTKSPLKAPDLYKLKSINNARSYEMLVEDLNYLADRKLLKTKVQENAPTLYYAAHALLDAEKIISEALAGSQFSDIQKQKLQKLLELMKAHDPLETSELKKDLIIAD